jgi:hypothetical protein
LISSLAVKAGIVVEGMMKMLEMMAMTGAVSSAS